MSKKILIVDDDPLTHRLLEHYLTSAGYEVLHAFGGIEGLKISANDSPDLVLMDIMMEDLNGLSALREMKKKEATKHIPVLVITSDLSVTAVYREEARLAGAAGFLGKPFAPTQLITEIHRLLPDHPQSVAKE